MAAAKEHTTRLRSLDWRDALHIAEFVVISVTAVFIWFQLKDARGADSALRRLRRIAAIDEQRMIRKENGGAFDLQLDNYLGLYEVMDSAYVNSVINKADV